MACCFLAFLAMGIHAPAWKNFNCPAIHRAEEKRRFLRVGKPMVFKSEHDF